MENLNKIKVVDSPMGFGKSSWAIQYMKDNPDKRFLYVTPFLDEVERISKAVPNMKTPYVNFKEDKAKFETLRDYTFKGSSIATTHALFSRLDLDMQENLIAGDYTLILDEVTNVAEKYVFGAEFDRDLFFEHVAYVDEEGYVCWKHDEDSEESKFAPSKVKKNSNYYSLMTLCKNRNLLKIDDNMYMWELAINIFKCFKDIYILTYMFEGSLQAPYFKLHNIKYDYLSVEGGKLLPYRPITKETKKELRELINIIDHEKLNDIGNDFYALSATWHEDKTQKSKQSVYALKLKNNTTNFFRNICKGSSTDNMISVFEDSYANIKDKGWSSEATSYIAFNIKATNKFRHKKNLAYLVNIFPHHDLKKYFRERHTEVGINEKLYALNIMVQWIWRSRIRCQDLPPEDRKINLYLPSRRMREILINWLNVDDADLVLK